MKKWFWIILIAGMFCLRSLADVTVTNLVVAQRPGTKLVDITYDLSSDLPNTFSVSLSVSNKTTINAVNLTGDLGSNVVAGSKKTIVWNTGADWNKTNAQNVMVVLTATANTFPYDMAEIPAGINSGIDPDYGAYSLTNATPLYMDPTEVTKSQWDAVYTWAITNGYSFDHAGSGKATNHPVQTVSWYDCVKWCNARSEKNGRTPCYTVGGNTYRTGQSSPTCAINVNGYRLPTGNEWEYAARAGFSGLRFPWGDEITHNAANYISSAGIAYDLSDTRGYNPSYDNEPYPYTSPVGSFRSNRYGLSDMAGNVAEWCDDLLGSGSFRMTRGGGWYSLASTVRCRSLGGLDSTDADFRTGFRSVCRHIKIIGSRVATTDIDSRDYLLTVSSECSEPVPVIGTNIYAWGTTITGSVQGSVIQGLTNWISVGWSGSGSVSASGVSTNTGGIVLTDLVSSITWNWNTNYWFEVNKAGNGSVSTSSGWVLSGTNVQITATPDTYYHFAGWSGDVVTNSATFTIMMSRPRLVTASFSANITTNTGTPEWWLAQYGLTNFNIDVTNDLDHDGLSTWQEYIAGCDPTNRASVLDVGLSIGVSGNEISWYGVNGRYYQLEYTENLREGWMLKGAIIQGADELIIDSDVSSVAGRFYRIRVSENASDFN